MNDWTRFRRWVVLIPAIYVTYGQGFQPNELAAKLADELAAQLAATQSPSLPAVPGSHTCGKVRCWIVSPPIYLI